MGPPEKGWAAKGEEPDVRNRLRSCCRLRKDHFPVGGENCDRRNNRVGRTRMLER